MLKFHLKYSSISKAYFLFYFHGIIRLGSDWYFPLSYCSMKRRHLDKFPLWCHWQRLMQGARLPVILIFSVQPTTVWCITTVMHQTVVVSCMYDWYGLASDCLAAFVWTKYGLLWLWFVCYGHAMADQNSSKADNGRALFVSTFTLWGHHVTNVSTGGIMTHVHVHVHV